MKRLTCLAVVLCACSSEPDPVNNSNNTENNSNNATDTGRDAAPDTTATDVADETRVDSSQNNRIDMAGDTGEGNLLFDEAFDDDFDLLAQDHPSWTLLHPDRATRAEISAGLFQLVPTELAQNAWFEQFQSPYLYRELSGDFIIQTTVRATSTDGLNIPAPEYNAAGFVFRDPASGPGTENWLMFNVGTQTAQVSFGVEVKTTVNSSSDLELFSIDPAEMGRTLRACRIGDQFRYFERPIAGGAWNEVLPNADHEREDFPNALQVGVMVGTWSAVDILGTFDRIIAWRPASDCAEALPE